MPRITSYNVCYTKLLRLLNKGEDLYTTFDGISGIIDKVDEKDASITRGVLEEIFTRYALISMGRSPVYDDITMNKEKYAGLLILRDRITSYNVCYTKLLRLIIFLFNYYISVAKDLEFKKRFFQMAIISLSVALISFGIGVLVKQFLGVEV